MTTPISSEAVKNYIKDIGKMKVEKLANQQIMRPFSLNSYTYAFCTLLGIQTDKMSTEYMLIDQMNL